MSVAFKKPAVVLSGGGFRGAYQEGVIEVLAGAGVVPAALFGVSVGNLNGAMWSQGDFAPLQRMWNTIKFRDVFGGFPPFNVVFKDGLYSNKPLKGLIDEYIDPERFQIPFFCGVVNMQTGQYETIKYKKKGEKNTWLLPMVREVGPPDLMRQYILASTSIPGYHTLPKIGGIKYADGGVRNVTPIGDVLSAVADFDIEIDSVIIINCTEYNYVPKKLKNPRGIVGNATFALKTLLNETMDADMRQFLTVNDLIRSGGSVYGRKAYPTMMFNPLSSGSSMSADRKMLNQLMSEGRRDATDWLGAL